MKRLLHIIVSPRQEKSWSESVAREFGKEYLRLNPSAQIDVLDLWKDPIPAFDQNKVSARMTFVGEGKLEGKLTAAWEEVVRITERFKSADDYLISIPMWNGSIPWILKQYIDTVTQPGLTFGFGKEGFFPLLKDKRACVIYTTGIYSPALPESFGIDFQSVYIEWWLKSIGIEQVYPIRYHGTIISADKEEVQKQAVVSAVQIANDHFHE